MESLDCGDGYAIHVRLGTGAVGPELVAIDVSGPGPWQERVGASWWYRKDVRKGIECARSLIEERKQALREIRAALDVEGEL